MNQESLFWADQIAKEIITRKKFKYINKEVPKIKKFVVKTSASLSGILHIGRLSDTIRVESVFRALKDQGVNTEIIWVAEDMDPLRKVPKGVPESYKKYIGMPVTDIPDPDGCHKSYAEHFVSEYFKVIDQFVISKMKRYSMREEYKKGSFKKYIQLILKNIDKVIEIQNRYRTNPLEKTWSPWQPICDNCGKIITTKIIDFKEGKARYKCIDYSFEKTVAKGCGHEDENDPLKGNGKLLWKSEWASQWAHWGVVSEGAGKEYQVPMSAWWVNSEILEKVFNFPMPVPIFYEHIMIDGEKMSASKGNIVYPRDWLKVAPSELLRFFYNKKLMKTRNFSWIELSKLYDDYDNHEDVFFGKTKVENEKERDHMKRLFEISEIGKPEEGIHIPFGFAVLLTQTTQNLNHVIEILKRTSHIKEKPTRNELEKIKNRLEYAKNWVNLYATEDQKIKLVNEPSKKNIEKISEKQKEVLKEFRKELEKKSWNEEELYSMFWNISKKIGITAPAFFEACYLVILGRPRGPRLSSFIIAVGKDKIIKLLKKIES